MKIINLLSLFVLISCGRSSNYHNVEIVPSYVYVYNSEHSCSDLNSDNKVVSIFGESYAQFNIEQSYLYLSNDCQYEIKYKAYWSKSLNKFVECEKSGYLLRHNNGITFVNGQHTCERNYVNQGSYRGLTGEAFEQLSNNLSSLNVSCVDSNCYFGNLPDSPVANNGLFINHRIEGTGWSYRAVFDVENRGDNTIKEFTFSFKLPSDTTQVSCWVESASNFQIEINGIFVTVRESLDNYWKNINSGQKRKMTCQINKNNGSIPQGITELNISKVIN